MTSPAQPQDAESRPAVAWPGRAGVPYEAQQQPQKGVLNYKNTNADSNMFLHPGVEFHTQGGPEISSDGEAGSASTGAIGVFSSGEGNNDVGLTLPGSPGNNESRNKCSGMQQQIFVAGNSTTSKSRTSCKLCTRRKKRCDYNEVDNKKQPCT